MTIGNWLRDWDFYFKLVEHCPQWDFQLVNRKLDQSYLDKYESLPNFTYFRDIDNDGVDQLILDAELQFLPVTGIAASNAITQAFGLGCPLVLTDIGQYDDKESFVSTYKPNDLDDCQEKIAAIIALSDNEKANLRRQAHEYAQGFSWESITQRTIDLYRWSH